MAQSKTFFSSFVRSASESFDICNNARFATDTAGFDAAQKIFTGFIIDNFYVACTQVESSSDLDKFREDVISSILQGDTVIYEITAVNITVSIVDTDTVISELKANINSHDEGEDGNFILQPTFFALVFEDSGSETIILQSAPVGIRSFANWLKPSTTLAAQQGRSLLEL